MRTDSARPVRETGVGHSTRTGQTGAIGPSAVAKNPGAPSNLQTSAGSWHVVGGRSAELCEEARCPRPARCSRICSTAHGAPGARHELAVPTHQGRRRDRGPGGSNGCSQRHTVQRTCFVLKVLTQRINRRKRQMEQGGDARMYTIDGQGC